MLCIMWSSSISICLVLQGFSSCMCCCGLQVEEIEATEKGLLQEAQRFFLLTQTDNMWKEHLQVRCTVHSYFDHTAALPLLAASIMAQVEQHARCGYRR